MRNDADSGPHSARLKIFEVLEYAAKILQITASCLLGLSHGIFIRADFIYYTYFQCDIQFVQRSSEYLIDTKENEYLYVF